MKIIKSAMAEGPDQMILAKSERITNVLDRRIHQFLYFDLAAGFALDSVGSGGSIEFSSIESNIESTSSCGVGVDFSCLSDKLD